MADDSTTVGAHPAQIPARVHALGPGRQLLEYLHEQRAVEQIRAVIDILRNYSG
jgi:hypothetical protein